MGNSFTFLLLKLIITFLEEIKTMDNDNLEHSCCFMRAQYDKPPQNVGAEDSVLSTLRVLGLDPAKLRGSSVLVEANRAEMSQMGSAASARQLGRLGCSLVPSPRVLSQQDTPATLCGDSGLQEQVPTEDNPLLTRPDENSSFLGSQRTTEDLSRGI